jgi:general L-amino acid transport system substrate-binding protein
MSKHLYALAMGAALLAAAPAASHAGPHLDRIKESGKIVCIVNPNSPRFSLPDSQGVFQGFKTHFYSGGCSACST